MLSYNILVFRVGFTEIEYINKEIEFCHNIVKPLNYFLWMLYSQHFDASYVFLTRWQ